MRSVILLSFVIMNVLSSCKLPKDNPQIEKSNQKRPTTGQIKNKSKDRFNSAESISKGACRIEGKVIDQQSENEQSLILEVTSFLGEGASFQTYRPRKGDIIEVTGLSARDYNLNEALKLEIQTLPKKPNLPIQKVGLIKILDL